jgi:hypothetical protein
MRAILIFLAGILFIPAFGQIINANPDSDGDIWIVGKIPQYTSEYIAKLNLIPELQLTQISSQTPLAVTVDNSTKKYMRTIFYQKDQSCAQAAGVAYTFTYETARLRNTDNKTDTTNYFPTHFTYNFLNGAIYCNCLIRNHYFWFYETSAIA